MVYDEVGYYDPEVKRIRVGQAGRFGFLDEHAREVVRVQLEYAEIFDKGKARVVLNGRELFIDPDGKELAEQPLVSSPVVAPTGVPAHERANDGER